MVSPKYAPRLQRSLGRRKKRSPTTEENQKSPSPSAALSNTMGNRALQNMVEQNPQMLAQDAHFRSAVGNQALQRMIARNSQPAAPVIQRLISLKDFDKRVPAVKGFLIRQQIRAAVKEYHAYVKDYGKKFPKKDFYAANRYHDEALAWIINHFNQLSELTSMYAQGLENKFEGQENPHEGLVRALRAWGNDLKKYPQMQSHDFATLHHDLMLQAAAKNPQFQFLSEQDREGNEIEGATEGGMNILGMTTFNTSKGRKTGFTKEDTGQLGDPGVGTGITKGSAKSSMRSVATFEVSDLMGLGIIPYTSLTKKQGEGGKEKVGQFMEKAPGTSGQGKVITQEIPPNQLEGISHLLQQLKNGKTSSTEKRRLKDQIERDLGLMEGFTEQDGKVYKLESVATDIDWENAVLQQQLNTLQFFDLLVGHADRHAGNYIIDSDPNDRQNITGVKGIDNDDTWGRKYSSTDFGNPKKSKTPTLPSVIDMLTALRFLKTEWNGIEGILEKYAMTHEEIAAAANRFYAVQDHIISLAQRGSIATLSGKADIADISTLQHVLKIRHGVTIDIKNYPLLKWGDETSQLLDFDNSYTGKQKFFKQKTLEQGGNLYQPEWN